MLYPKPFFAAKWRIEGRLGQMRQGIFITAILGFFAALSTSVAARDYFVDNSMGDDRYNGTTAELSGDAGGPFRSIGRALREAGKGDRVVIANTGEPYRESVTLQGGRHSGIPGAYFEVIGNGATLDGTRPVPASAWSFYEGSVFRFRPPRTSFQQLYLDGKPATRRTISQLEEIKELQPSEWCLFDRHIYFSVDVDRLPQSYNLSYADLPVGITMYEVRLVVVRDLVIQGFQLDGVNAHDGVFDGTLEGLNCRGNGRSGISVGGASRVKVESCLVGNNGAAQVRTEGYSRTHLVGCDLLDNTAPRIVRDGGTIKED
jgi:hypothetical protein